VERAFEEVSNIHLVDGRRDEREREERLHLGGDRERVIARVDVERFDAEPIASAEGGLLVRVPDDERERPDQVLGTMLPHRRYAASNR